MTTLDTQTFRKHYGLKQKDLADILGVSRSFIAQCEAGYSKFPRYLVDKLGGIEDYDISPFLIDENQAPSNSADAEIASLKNEIEDLKQQLEEVKAEKDKYWETIQKLIR